MLTFFKCVVFSWIDYGSQLWSTTQIKSLNKIERVQRSFTKFIPGMRPLSYEDRLKSLHLYSVQRQFERYTIIYTYYSKKITFFHNIFFFFDIVVSHRVDKNPLGGNFFSGAVWHTILFKVSASHFSWPKTG